jgi:hypothetical protein
MNMQEFNLIDKLDEIGMLYFVIVSLFSAETLVDVESCKVSLKGHPQRKLTEISFPSF